MGQSSSATSVSPAAIAIVFVLVWVSALEVLLLRCNGSAGESGRIQELHQLDFLHAQEALQTVVCF